MLFFTSDQHFGHDNIRKYCNRDFPNISDMDETLIDAWNKVVKADDLVYHLGDFTLGGRSDAEKYFRRSNGYIHILEYPWHHDKRWLTGQLFYSAQHEVAYEQPIVVLEHEADRPIILCHYAFEIWDRKHYGSLHFHGHSHGMLPRISNRLDIGVDNAFQLMGEYRPFSIKEALEVITDA